MSNMYLKKIASFSLIAMLTTIVLIQCSSSKPDKIKPRILISSDIGGTDPDDFQSMIHLLARRTHSLTVHTRD